MKKTTIWATKEKENISEDNYRDQSTKLQIIHKHCSMSVVAAYRPASHDVHSLAQGGLDTFEYLPTSQGSQLVKDR